MDREWVFGNPKHRERSDRRGVIERGAAVMEEPAIVFRRPPSSPSVRPVVTIMLSVVAEADNDGWGF
uniref:Uncharacterized protein n=1 Tax=Helianthus annuus TaxID=4232 RepID=A0A251V2F9_HELAN